MSAFEDATKPLVKNMVDHMLLLMKMKERNHMVRRNDKVLIEKLDKFKIKYTIVDESEITDLLL